MIKTLDRPITQLLALSAGGHLFGESPLMRIRRRHSSGGSPRAYLWSWWALPISCAPTGLTTAPGIPGMLSRL
jgi:hypothetical protein